MDDGVKGQLADRIKNATNILITVSRDPSVDALAAALGLSLMLNKQDKHATAVFSGKIPPAITFLEPDKTFEHTVDGLRDFIIALDKNKADRLRFKTDDDVVRIFVTPYRTTISDKDLQFSQGDFNVELIIALGVEQREDLDTAITAHGRILHDATVVTVNTKEEKNSLGALDWQAPKASGLSEMVVDLQESLGENLLDEQVATALLTGLVASTSRFSNELTNSRTMSLAAQLMAAGANQQLIAAKLDEEQPIPEAEAGGGAKLREIPELPSEEKKNEPKEESAPEAPKEESQPEAPSKRDIEMRIDHSQEEAAPQQPQPEKEKPKKPQPPKAENVPKPQPQKPQTPAQPPSQPPAQKDVSVDDLKKDLAAASQEIDKAAEETTSKSDQRPFPKIEPVKQQTQAPEVATPALGGTLNATTEQAAVDKKKQEAADRNRTVLTHDKPAMGQPSQPQAAFNAYAPGATQSEPPSVDPFGQQPPQGKEPAPEPPQDNVGNARQAVEAALESAPFDPAHHPEERSGAQTLPPLHDTPSQPQPSPQAPQPQPAATSPQLPPMPPMEEVPLPPPPPPPNTGSLPPMPPAPQQPQASQPPQPDNQPQPSPQSTQTTAPPPPPIAPLGGQDASTDPGQFKIPGQQ